MKLVWLEEAKANTITSLFRLYHTNPFTHIYIVYDMTYYPDRTKAVLLVDDENNVVGYVMAYYSGNKTFMHAWNTGANTLGMFLGRLYGVDSIVLQLHGSSTDSVEDFARVLGSYGFSVEIVYYLDMAITSSSPFKPYYAPRVKVVRLGREHAIDYVDLEASRGRTVSVSDARGILESLRCYGAYVDSVLASIACTYIRMPEAWLIGNVYTRPTHRGRGLAKTVTSTVTAQALNCGAKPFLHVEESNRVAIHVYERLGYKTLKARPWIRALRTPR